MKILFICSNMKVGGFQKSLINLLSTFDYNKYNIDLLLIEKNGIFLSEIPNEVSVLNVDNIESSFFIDFKTSINMLMKKRNYYLVFWRIIVALISFFDKGYGAILMSKFIPKINQQYDCCIDYNGQYLNYYMIDRVDAKKKITYFHSDYSKWDYYKRADKKYYKKADAIVTVSDICVESMKTYFPEYSNKIVCIENIITTKTVKSNSCDISFRKNEKCCLVTVGRVCEDKGIRLAIETCKLLKENQIDVCWYWIGPGASIWKNEILKNSVEEFLILLGPSTNPYSFIRQADICIYPSKYEGKAVVIEETKVINKPIVATNFSTVKNQIEDNKSGIIVDMNAGDLFDAILGLIRNPNKMKEIMNFQRNYCLGNGQEIEKLYKLMEEGTL